MPFEEAARDVAAAKAQAHAQGHEIGVYTVGVVTVRPTQREADEYAHYVEENTDWNAVDAIISGTSDKSALWSVNAEDEYHETATERSLAAA